MCSSDLRSAVRFKGFRSDVMPGTPRNDLDWEIYPEGLYKLCREFYKKYRAPIWITENGTCDGKDSFRARYIYDHLYEVSRLCGEGIPVERYYHWTLMDNFEWLEGESPASDWCTWIMRPRRAPSGKAADSTPRYAGTTA